MFKINSLWYSAEPAEGFFSQRIDENIDVYYQKRYRCYVFEHIPRRRVMIDVGACIGIFARPAAHVFEKVICFEPVSRNFQVLEKNMQGLSNVELYPLGLSDRPQHAIFDLMPLKTGETKQVAEFVPRPDHEKYEGDLVTLDSFGFDQVDWIKVDVEGYEMQVLEGGRETIRRNRPWLLLERNGQDHVHGEWLNDLCGPYQAAPVKSKTNTIWIPQ